VVVSVLVFELDDAGAREPPSCRRKEGQDQGTAAAAFAAPE
jgi:hypothetical protein